jgi:hypothetical protein
MTWFKVDDQLAFHPKTVACGNQAMGLWVRAGAWSAQMLTNGHIPDAMIVALGGTADDAKALVDGRFWHAPGAECEVCEAQGLLPFEEGYQFHNWIQYQPVRVDVRLAREEQARSGREGSHQRWHVKRGIVNPSCDFCRKSDT